MPINKSALHCRPYNIEWSCSTPGCEQSTSESSSGNQQEEERGEDSQLDSSATP